MYLQFNCKDKVWCQCTHPIRQYHLNLWCLRCQGGTVLHKSDHRGHEALIYTQLYKLPCLILLLDGRWRRGLDIYVMFFSSSAGFSLNTIWVNVSTLFCSSVCLRAHRSRQAPRLIPSLTHCVSDTSCLNTPSRRTMCQCSHQENYNNPFLKWGFVLNLWSFFLFFLQDLLSDWKSTSGRNVNTFQITCERGTTISHIKVCLQGLWSTTVQ